MTSSAAGPQEVAEVAEKEGRWPGQVIMMGWVFRDIKNPKTLRITCGFSMTHPHSQTMTSQGPKLREKLKNHIRMVAPTPYQPETIKDVKVKSPCSPFGKSGAFLSAEHQGIDDRLDQRAKGHHETQDPPQFGHTDLIEPGQGLGASDSTYRHTSVRSYSWCLPSRKNYHELPSHSYDICIWTYVHTAHMWLHNIQTCTIIYLCILTYNSMLLFCIYIYMCVYIYVYICKYIYTIIWAISKTLGSRKGHPQIWEGPIAYHTFVQ